MERKVSSIGKITAEIICGYLFYGILFIIMLYLLTRILSLSISFADYINGSGYIKLIISLILNGIAFFIVSNLAIKSTFKKRCAEDEIARKKIIRNMTIFIIICLFIEMFFLFNTYNKFNMLASQFNSLQNTSNQLLNLLKDNGVSTNTSSIASTDYLDIAKNVIIIGVIFKTLTYCIVLFIQKKNIIKNI